MPEIQGQRRLSIYGTRFRQYVIGFFDFIVFFLRTMAILLLATIVRLVTPLNFTWSLGLILGLFVADRLYKLVHELKTQDNLRDFFDFVGEAEGDWDYDEEDEEEVPPTNQPPSGPRRVRHLTPVYSLKDRNGKEKGEEPDKN